METTIYLIRHAQSLQSPNQHYSEWPLSETGQYQAGKLAELLKPLGIEHIYSSPFIRCLQTIEPFKKTSGISVDVRDDLREQLIADEFMDGFLGVWNKCWADFNYAYPNCESCSEAQTRFVAEMMNIVVEKGKSTIGISSHGAVISLFLKHIESFFHRKDAEKLKNPDVCRVVYDGKRLFWDQDFRLPGIDDITSDPRDTPVCIELL